MTERALPHATLMLRKLSVPDALPSRWTLAKSGATSFEGTRFQGNHYVPKSQLHSSAGHEGAQTAKSDRHQEDG